MAQWVKNPPAMQEMQVQSLGWEDPLEEDMATHSSILALRISWIKERGGLQSIGSQRVGYDWIDWACTHACKLSMILKIGTTDVTIMAMVNPIFWTI